MSVRFFDEEMETPNDTVKFFDAVKGYGFITDDAGGLAHCLAGAIGAEHKPERSNNGLDTDRRPDALRVADRDADAGRVDRHAPALPQRPAVVRQLAPAAPAHRAEHKS